MQVNALSSIENILNNLQTQQAAKTSESSEDFSSYLDTGSTSLDQIFQKAADTYGVDVNLLKAVAKQESNFDASATSGAGAQGIMQLMPATARELGVTDSYDPEQNIMAGAKYLSKLLSSYGGDTALALAAYNAGSGNVAKYGGIPPFEETQNYVTKVLGYYNEGVTVPDGSDSISSSAAADTTATSSSLSGDASIDTDQLLSQVLEELEDDSSSQDAEELFTEAMYYKFIDIYLDFISGGDSDEDQTSIYDSLTGDVSQDSISDQLEEENDAYYMMQNISYNSAVLDLLTGNTKGII